MTSVARSVADLTLMADSEDLVREWVNHRRRAGLITAGSARNHRAQLDFFARAHPGGLRVDRRSIRRWLESIGHLSAGSRRSHVSTVRNFLRWAAAEGHVSAKIPDLLPTVRQPRAVPRALSTAQVHQLLTGSADDRMTMIVALMLFAGLRCGEVAALQVEDVDERTKVMLIHGKAGNQRMLPIPDELAPIISRWLDGRRRVPGPFITGRWGGLQASTISTMVSRAMADAGVKVSARDGRSAHALRHTAASDVLDRGASITTVQTMLGHSSIGSTSVYLRRARLDDLRKAMAGRDYS
jgi:site-specific recombinase XerD